MKIRIPSLIWLLLTADSLLAQSFVSPIGGVPFQDWTIVNYVDLEPGSSIIDFQGGNYTYNRHNAIDYTLPNFAAMDAGVSVNAVSPGIVINVHDGEYDRWSRANPTPSGARPNSVLIVHANGVITEYLHLRQNSISVNIGDPVAAGQQIGLVGSSGNSSDAHLHFAVYENGNLVETYQDPDRWWLEPLPYAGDVYGSLDHGIINYSPTVNDLVERPMQYDEFDIQDGNGQIVRSWANVFGYKNGDDVDYFLFEPDGDEFGQLHWTSGQIRYGWWNASFSLPTDPELGRWAVEAKLNGETIFRDTFRVFDSAIVPEPAQGCFCLGGVGWVLIRRRRDETHQTT